VTIRAVIFDMDGLLLDSEVYWEEARRGYCRAMGCTWSPQDELAVKGYNSPEWAARIRTHCALDVDLGAIVDGVAARMRALYEKKLPLLPGAVEVVKEVARHYPAAIASSSPLDIIEFATIRAGLRPYFAVVTSADTVGRGKPAPDVFLAAARHLGVAPGEAAVFEDSTAGITAGHTAGMLVIAVPNPHYPPSRGALELADIVLPSLEAFRLTMLAMPAGDQNEGKEPATHGQAVESGGDQEHQPENRPGNTHSAQK
jgi:HAD superfamily hydrolase (TIGR01509 family)